MVTDIQKLSIKSFDLGHRPVRKVLNKQFEPLEPVKETKPANQSVPAKKERSFAFRFFIGIIKLVLYVAFVSAAVYYTPKILSKQLHTQYPMATITSGSMWPALKTNDLILMKGATAADVHIGQIIIFKNEQGFTIHRLIRVQNGKFVTKGDANDVEDPPIEASAVIGRVVYVGSSPFHIPMLGIIAKDLGPKLSKFEGR